MLGEAAILWQLSVQPQKGFPVTSGGRVPPYVYIVLTAVFLFGTWWILQASWRFHEARRPPEPDVWTPNFQVTAWVLLVFGSAATFWFGYGLIGIAMLLLAVMLPI